MLSSLNPNFHNAIIQSLNVDFESKTIRLFLKQERPKEGILILSQLDFEQVAWQDFRDFNALNCIWDIEMSDSFADHDQYQKGKPFSVSDHERLKTDKTLKYYFFTSKSGLKACIVSKNVSVAQTEQPI